MNKSLWSVENDFSCVTHHERKNSDWSLIGTAADSSVSHTRETGGGIGFCLLVSAEYPKLFFLSPGDSSEYRINGVHVTFATYIEELQKIGIVTKAQNCLVFQVKYYYT